MLEKILIPDIGGPENVNVIEVMVSVGDTISVDDPLLTLEGDKATMDVPSSQAGVVKTVDVKVGDKVAEGSLILTLKRAENSASETPIRAQAKADAPKQTAPEKTVAREKKVIVSDESEDKSNVHAGPGVRRVSHEFNIPLNKISGTGPKGRILKEDIEKYVNEYMSIGKSEVSIPNFSTGSAIDFTQFGSFETKPLSKIKKISAANLHRNWVSIPHVTQFDEADITELEEFRQRQKKIALDQGIRLTLLVFIMKAVVSTLHKFEQFNASLDSSGENLIYKKYFHIGVAVDTPNGLVVPVIRDVDKKGMFDIAEELGEISEKARERCLSISDMQGGCFTISSLGGIGGAAFTPIINAPEVAILGVSKSVLKPIVQSNNEILPRLMLPLSLSYDHRVIDGAEAARFIIFLSSRLADIRNILL